MSLRGGCAALVALACLPAPARADVEVPGVEPRRYGLVVEVGAGGPLHEIGAGLSLSVQRTIEVGIGVGKEDRDGGSQPRAAFWLRHFVWQREHLRLGWRLGGSWGHESATETFRAPHRPDLGARFDWDGFRLDAGVVIATLWGGLVRVEPGFAVLLATPSVSFDGRPWLDVEPRSPRLVPELKVSGAFEWWMPNPTRAPQPEKDVSAPRVQRFFVTALGGVVANFGSGFGGRLELAINPGAAFEVRLGMLGGVFREADRQPWIWGVGPGARVVACWGDRCRVQAAVGATVVKLSSGGGESGGGSGAFVPEFQTRLRVLSAMDLLVGAAGIFGESFSGATVTPWTALRLHGRGLFVMAGVPGPFVAAGLAY